MGMVIILLSILLFAALATLAIMGVYLILRELVRRIKSSPAEDGKWRRS